MVASVIGIDERLLYEWLDALMARWVDLIHNTRMRNLVKVDKLNLKKELMT